MLQVKYIREHKDRVKAGLKIRNFKDEELGIVDQIIETDDRRKTAQQQLDRTLNEEKTMAKEIGGLYKQGKREAAEELKIKVASLKEQSKQLQEQFNSAAQELEDLLLQVPNVPHESVPAGNSDADNEVYKAWSGDLPQLPESALPHWELAKKYNLFDLDLGVKITGAGFPLYRSKGAKLQRALINFFLDEAEAAGYEEIIPPHMVNAASARGTGQLPDKEGQMYHITADELYLIPTAEVPITNIHRGDILNESDFPIKLTGYTPCFRREGRVLW